MTGRFSVREKRWAVFASILLGICAAVFLWGTLYPVSWLALIHLGVMDIFLSQFSGWLPPEVIAVQAALLLAGGVASVSLLSLWGKVLWRCIALRRMEVFPLSLAIAMSLLATTAVLSLRTLAWQGVVRRVRLEKRLYPVAAYLFYTQDLEYRKEGGDPPEVELIQRRFITRGDGHYVTPPPGYGLLGESLSFYEVFVTPPTVRIPLSVPLVSVIVSYGAPPQPGDLIETKYANHVLRRVTELGDGAFVVELASERK